MVSCRMKQMRNTRFLLWPELKDTITIWDDFNLLTLNESYGHVLDAPVPEQQLNIPAPDQVLADVVINEDLDMNHLISWNDALMKPTLNIAKSHLGLHSGVMLRHKFSTADKSFMAKITSAPPRNHIDHVIELDDFPTTNLVVGLSRPSAKWSGRRLAYQVSDASMNPEVELLWPLRQLAQCCRFAKTRYGYIQTDEEMVVCCFSKKNNEDNENRWKVAIMPIPWSRHGVDVLTTDLALWWLCMLAMSAKHHREIVREEQMVRINSWEVTYLDDERGWVGRHQYSNVEEPRSPPPPPDYRTPSPGDDAGNLAAFEAAIGIHADEWIDHFPNDANVAGEDGMDISVPADNGLEQL